MLPMLPMSHPDAHAHVRTTALPPPMLPMLPMSHPDAHAHVRTCARAHMCMCMCGRSEKAGEQQAHLVKLVHKLDPVQTQRVEKGREQLHAAEDANGDTQPAGECGHEGDAAREGGAILAASKALVDEDHLVEDSRELLMREGESPEPKVGGRV